MKDRSVSTQVWSLAGLSAKGPWTLMELKKTLGVFSERFKLTAVTVLTLRSLWDQVMLQSRVGEQPLSVSACCRALSMKTLRK